MISHARTKSFALAVAVIGLLALGGCDLRLTSPDLPATFVLAPGETARAGGLRVRFLEVVSDSRCPADAVCIALGDAVAAFELRAEGQNIEVELAVVAPDDRAVEFEDFVVEFLALGPYPFSNQPIPPGDYRATIEVDRD
jgi:hypothetical protein